MKTMLVRLKAYDPRHGYTLRRYTFRGIKFQQERGWYRVTAGVAEYLRDAHQDPTDPKSPLAFDVCSDAEAKAMETAEKESAAVRKGATDTIKVSEPRATTTQDLPESKASKGSKPKRPAKSS